MIVSPAPCHLRPSDKKRLAAINAAKRAAAERRALNERIGLLKVCYHCLFIVKLCSCVVVIFCTHRGGSRY